MQRGGSAWQDGVESSLGLLLMGGSSLDVVSGVTLVVVVVTCI